ncbi:HD domain-containing protein [Desulfovibrio desulfuricans]|uniref:HD domain-containing protein n=1 Tax=Desulfovibrio desulfuricans TaxID=876 RepID=UPI0035AED6B0
MEEYLKKIGVKNEKIRDPIYGFIPITLKEKTIIDTPLFQRLRRINQLALTKYVYPSAEHSRFVHSIGVMHCSTLILDGVFSHKETNLNFEPSQKSIKTLRYAALLHDIGHLPFSHAVEKQWLCGLKHEDVSIYIIKNYRQIRDILESDGIDCNEVASLIGKKPAEKDQLFHEVISGQLDADRADYLLRDSHACGVRYGEYDFPRFLQIFSAKEDATHGSLSLCVDEKDLHVAESLLIARYHYNLQIPYHRTRSGYDFVLKKFAKENVHLDNIFEINGSKIDEINFKKLELLDDGSVFEKIKDKFQQNNKWANYLMRQMHLCPIIDTNALDKDSVDYFKKSVTALRASPDLLVEDEDYFIQEQPVEMLKRAQRSGECDKPSKKGSKSLPEGSIRLLVDSYGGAKKQVDIRNRSWIFNRLNKEPHKILRVYVVEEKKDHCKQIIKQLCRKAQGGLL